MIFHHPQNLFVPLLLTLSTIALSCDSSNTTTSTLPIHSAEVVSSAALNINTASANELEQLPGVGIGVAERIVAHRQRYGPFRRPEHLIEVDGVSDRKFRELRHLIRIE